jgi:hypothetical protein
MAEISEIMNRKKLGAIYWLFSSSEGWLIQVLLYIIFSNHQAALDFGISYRKAWIMLQNAGKKLGFALIGRKVEGAAGGGSQITPSGKSS